MNADEDLVVLGNRLFDLLDLYDLRRSVSAIYGGLHTALAYLFHRHSLALLSKFASERQRRDSATFALRRREP